jgi:aminopeptidase N
MVWHKGNVMAFKYNTMKCKTVLLLLVISFIKAVSQNSDSTIQLLEPLDCQIMDCVKSKIGQKEKCVLFIRNETDKPIQGYWISNTNLLCKVKFGFIDANQSKRWNIKTQEYWVFSDLNNNVLGFYKTLPGRCKIIINDSNFLKTRKLPTNIKNKDAPGTFSGGPVIEEQAAYDVTHYDIKMEIFPDKRFIKGTNTISVIVTNRFNSFVFDLDTFLTVKNVFLEKETTKVPLMAKWQKGKYWCKLPQRSKKGDILKICVEYEGSPRIATNAPYQGGFSWNKTENCQPWVATSCQPDSVKLSFTVPNGLKAISNGVLKDTIDNKNGTTTYYWEENNPISNYAIALNMAPYFQLKDDYVSCYGDTINIFYWVLPENLNSAKEFYPNIKSYLKFIETTIGPYPFRNEKLGIIEVPFVGMEHQTIIAYGPNYTTKSLGYNYVLYHEICHEWFGNMVTAHDWNDFWIQEGLTGYMEALYEEQLNGEEGYQKKMALRKRNVKNEIPIASDSIVNSRNGFDGDSYVKGMYLMHSLRYLIGKENIIKVLRLMAYPNKQLEQETSGSQCRFATTNDFFKIVEDVSKKNYDWFEDIYFKNAEVPTLKVSENKEGTILRWITKKNLPFKMPLEIRTKDDIQKIYFVENIATIDIKRNEILEFDPNHWILFNIEK